MCLGKRLSSKKTKEALDKMDKHGYIGVYKVVGRTKHRFTAPVEDFTYREGIMDSGYSGSIFDSYKGFHAFCDLKSANNYKLRLAIKTFPYISVAVRNNEIVIKCLAKRSWVIDVGVDINTNTIRLTKLCFPKCPNKKVTVREFRNELKKETK